MSEKHHISYKPKIIVKIPLKEHHKIHNTSPNTSELTTLMRQYDKLVKLSVMIQNWQTSFVKEFGIEKILVNVNFKDIEQEKYQILSIIKKLIKKELEKISIKGIGVRYLAGILAYAHPNRFSRKRKFLHYCGYAISSNITKKYSRKIHSLGYQIVKSVIMHKDEKYYKFYLEVKTKLQANNLHFSKSKINGKAINRVGTAIFSEIYTIFGRKDIED